ncbi:MAG: nicotinate phosphoribosyltransferase [Acidobacteria bacterium]|nr:nicotinate phosphoribosyltransferase [Acidobacteriota bacterium]
MSEHLQALTLCEGDLSFATDLYQLTMAAAYHAGGTVPRATFELFVRRLPEHRNFLVFAGLEQALAALEDLRFSPEQLGYLRSLPVFAAVPDSFFELLAGFRFRGDVDAVAEGTVFFPTEPVLRVTGSLIEAQLVETLLLAILNFQTAIASKAARMVLAAEGEATLAEFGSRRAHGPQAGAWVARAAYLAGFDSTSNVLAGQRLGVPVVGTMAHSFVQSFVDECDAFRHYHDLFPNNTIYLVDTYDTLEGVRKAVALGLPFQGVRIDSGDLAELAVGAREILDGAGFTNALIFGSGDLDEWRVEELRRRGVPFDAYGIGTQLAACADAPHLGGVYKLVAVEESGSWRPSAKASTGKATYPGRKQVLRRLEDGRLAEDTIVLEADAAGGEGLLRPVMIGGDVLDTARGSFTLEAARKHCREELAALPDALRRLPVTDLPFSAKIHPRLEALRRRRG